MTKIHERFLNEAVRIRKEYLKTLRELLEKENIVDFKKKELLNIVNDVDFYMKQDENDVDRTMLNNKLLDIEKSINSITNEIFPLQDIVDKLKEDSRKLFYTIKEKYPDMSEKDIQKEIIDNLIEKSIG